MTVAHGESSGMTRLMGVFVLVAALAFAGPAAAVEGEVVEEVNAPCPTTEGVTVVTPSEGFTGTVPTPVGVIFEGPSPVEDAGSYIVDLAGRPVGSKATVTTALSWDLSGEMLGDYDVLIDGAEETVEESTDFPDVHERLNVRHCQVLDLQTRVFTGLPLDTLTLEVTAR